MSSALRLLAVHAHPDDESSKGAATTASYAAQGVRVMVATLTGGERGDVLNPNLVNQPDLIERLPQVRKAEMAAAAAALGVEHRWIGFVDSGLPEGDPLPPLPPGSFATLEPSEAAVPLANLLREFQPQVVTTYDPQGGYPHPDHIQTHKVTMAALDLAADPNWGTGMPWRVAKVYYDRGFSVERMRALHEAMQADGLQSPYGQWLANLADRPRRSEPITTRITVGEYFPARDQALRAHATQVDPDGWFFLVPRQLEQAVWPWEEFELVRSDVSVNLPEDDLFAGLR